MTQLMVSLFPWGLFWLAAIPAQFKLGAILGLCVNVLLVFYHAEKPRRLEMAGISFFFIAGMTFNFGDAILYLSFVWLAAVLAAPSLIGKSPTLLFYFGGAEEATPERKKAFTIISFAWSMAMLVCLAAAYEGSPITASVGIVLALGFSIYADRKAPV